MSRVLPGTAPYSTIALGILQDPDEFTSVSLVTPLLGCVLCRDQEVE